MKLVWHIIKKDVVRFRWELAIWAVAFAYSLNLGGVYQPGDWRYYLKALSNITSVVLFLAMIVGVVQEDNLVELKAHWKTRAIAPVQLLVAKLIFILLFLIQPLLIAQQLVSVPVSRLMSGSDILYLASGMIALPLMFAALAACTKNLGHAMLLLLGVVGASAGLAYLIGKVGPELPGKLPLAKAVLIFASAAAVSLGVLISQYLIRQFWLSVSLLVGGVVMVAVIGSSWTWNFLR